jgi:hypothetical protein
MLDHIIIGTYLFLLLFLGIYNRSKGHNIRNYGKIDLQTQGKILFLLATIFTNSVGGGTVFGLSERVFTENLSYVYAIALTISVDILIAVFWVPRIAQHYGVISIGEIMAKHYGKIGKVLTGISATLVSFGYVAVQISVSSRIFQYVLHVNYVEGVILSYLILITYTAIGGLRSIIFTNFFQFLAIVVFLPIISIVGVYKIGFGEFITAIPVAKYYSANMWQDTFMLFLSFSLMGFYPGFIQRAFMTQDYKNTQKAIFGKSIVYGIFLIFISINGLLSYFHYSEIDSNLALLHLIENIIPIGLRGMVIIGLLAAVMSTSDSELNIASISLINDVFGPLFKLHDNRVMLLFTQIATLIVGSLAIFLALKFNNTVDLVLFVAGFWLPLIVVPFVACLYGITVSNIGLLVCGLVGFSAFAYWQIYFADIMNLKSAFIGLIANLACFITLKLLQYVYKYIKCS